MKMIGMFIGFVIVLSSAGGLLGGALEEDIRWVLGGFVGMLIGLGVMWIFS